MKINKFKKEIPEIKQVLTNNAVQNYVKNTLVSVLNTLEIKDSTNIVDDVLKIAVSYNNIDEYETNAHILLENKKVTKKIPQKLTNRADLIYDQIKDHIQGNSVLDLGCGDGKVAEKLANSKLEVTLADTYKHSHINSTGLEFVEFKQEENVPLTNQYDTSLVLTVMHHSNDPIKTLREAKRLTKKGGTILVIESVYGIDDNTAFGKLSHEEQRLTNVFFDHFYNRVIHYSDNPDTKVNVPFNFNTPDGWKEIFEQNGLEQKNMQYLGMDQPLVPEYHTLHVLEVK